MANICLHFYLNPRKRLRAFNIFDLGADTGYFDEKPLFTEVGALIEEGFPLLAQELKNLASSKKQSICGMMFSGAFWEFLDQQKPKAWAQIESLIKGGLIDLVAQPHYQSLNFLIDRELFQEEVALSQQRIQTLQGKKSKVLYHTDLLYNDFLGYWTKQQGLSLTFTPYKPGILQSRNRYQLFHPPHTPDVGLMVPDDGLVKEIMIEGRNAEELYQLLEPIFSQNHLISLRFDLSQLLRKPHTVMKLFYCLRRLQAEEKAHFVSPDEVAGWSSDGGQLSMPDFHSIHDESGTDPWLGNLLQKEAWLALYSQRAILEAYPFIQDARNLLNMGQKDSSSKQYLQAYRQFRGILTDFNLKKSNKSS